MEGRNNNDPTIFKDCEPKAGFVILYFNLGLKPPGQIKDEMARFMNDVAPGFRR